jgi:hypothetical protein
MNDHRFDEFARSIARSRTSRRALIKALVGSGVAGMVGLAWRQPASAAKRCSPARLRRRTRCRRDSQCCPGLVCQERMCAPGCHIGDQYYAAEATNPDNPCQSCQPATTTTAWTSSTCDDECQVCDPATGECVGDPARALTVCGELGSDGLQHRLCFDTCQAPCGEDCLDYCYLDESTSGGLDPSNPRCCPASARGADGACCWVYDEYGIFVDGECTALSQVCANGQACPTECCGGSDSGFAGTCPSSTQFCVDGVIKDASAACTTDQDCADAGYGTTSVCAGLNYTCGNEGEPIPNQDSGTCCPGDYISGPPDNECNGGPVYSCCEPGTRFEFGSGCCDYPAYRFDCPSCTCSFRSISRCC